jgi:hypothetical protein
MAGQLVRVTVGVDGVLVGQVGKDGPKHQEKVSE